MCRALYINVQRATSQEVWKIACMFRDYSMVYGSEAMKSVCVCEGRRGQGIVKGMR